MDHEVDDATVRERAKVLGRHPEEVHVMGQELSGRGEEHGESTGEQQPPGEQEQQGPAVTEDRRPEPRVGVRVREAHRLHPHEVARAGTGRRRWTYHPAATTA